jgi:redox-sensitive bicupin YhaK (pirin superfamily)
VKKARPVKKTLHAKPTLEGAGVHLNRVFGYHEAPAFDPFLLLDDFRSADPEKYLPGFPWHPHRGIETITYMIEGSVEHGDSLGNKGLISAGDVQWMTAGSGIIHQEMPKGDDSGRMGGFQLWANLPASQKMMAPRYRDVTAAQIPEVTLEDGVKIRIICGKVGKTQGPVRDIVIEPEYLDITVPAGAEYLHPAGPGHTVFTYGLGDNTLNLYGQGDHVRLAAGKSDLRVLLMAGKPIGEPVAWYGPIVMNTEEELKTAFEEYRNGTFIKNKR